MMTMEAVPQFEEKLFYKINEVSKITEIEDYVLRYWESEFPQLCPQKNKNKARLYKKEDILLVLKIKKLLKEQKFTISGAKEYLKKEAASIKESQQEKKITKSQHHEISITKDKIVSLRGKVSDLRKEVNNIISSL